MGVAVSTAAYAAVGIDRMITLAVDDAYSPDEADQLRDESDVMRLLLLDQLVDLSATDAEALTKRLGLYEDTVDEGSLIRVSIPDRAGRVSLEIAQNMVVDIHNYCWRFGGECAIFEVSD